MNINTFYRKEKKRQLYIKSAVLFVKMPFYRSDDSTESIVGLDLLAFKAVNQESKY